MKQTLNVLFAACVVMGGVGWAGAQEMGPAQPPSQTVELQNDGRCRPVHAGDTVRFSLTIENVQNARSVMADLQLRTGHGGYRETDLPLPGAGNLGGGGAGMRDAGFGKVYHFAFTIGPGVTSGVYRGAGIAVTANFAPDQDHPVEADVERRVREQVRHFCLAVVGPGPAGGYPVVTDFHPDGIDRK